MSFSDIPIGTAITSDLQYGLKAQSVRSRSYRLSLAPSNASVFLPNDLMSFDIPCSRQNTYLDQSQSYIQFSLRVATAAATASTAEGAPHLENTAYGLIQRLVVSHSSNQLEDINAYGDLANLLIDLSLSSADKASLSTMIGSNALSTANISAAAINAPVNFLKSPGDRSGLAMATTTSLATAPLYTFALPLMSGILGTWSPKMLSVGSLSSPIRADFYLAGLEDGIVAGAPGMTWQISAVSLQLCYVELMDDVISIGPDETRYISSTSYRHTTSFLPSNTSGEITLPVPLRYSSMKNIYARFRNFPSATNAMAGYGYRRSSSVNPNISSYSFRAGALSLPQTPIVISSNTVGGPASVMAELMKSQHALSTSIGNSSITSTQFNRCLTLPAATNLGQWQVPCPVAATFATLQQSSNNAFFIGLELESIANRGDTILCGLNTIANPLFLNFITYNTVTVDINIDFFAAFDTIIIEKNGILSVRF